MRTTTDPSQWGIVGMMKRIEELETRFKAMIPMPPVGGDNFQKKLEQSLETLQEPEGASMDGTRDYLKPPQYDELLKTDAGRKAPGTELDDLISSVARKNGLSEDLIRAVVKAESNFNSKAVSPKGAMGLMQLMPGTANMYGVSNPFDPAQNVEAGARHLKMLVERYGGDVELALAAYNAGERAVETYKGIPPYEETQTYVSRVMGMLKGAQ